MRSGRGRERAGGQGRREREVVARRERSRGDAERKARLRLGVGIADYRSLASDFSSTPAGVSNVRQMENANDYSLAPCMALSLRLIEL